MNTKHRNNSNLFLILLAVAIVGYSCARAENEKSVESIKAAFKQCDNQWQNHLYSKYYTGFTKAVSEAFMTDPHNTESVFHALDQISKFLELDVDPIELNGQHDLEAKLNIANQLLEWVPNANVGKEDLYEINQARGMALSRILESFFDELIPDYKTLPVYANVPPPPETEKAFSGMRPSQIKDPELRQKYEQTIQENLMRSIQNKRQSQIRGNIIRLENRIVQFLETHFAENPTLLNTLKNYNRGV